MIKYPMHFEGHVKSTKGMETPLQADAEGLPPINCAIPKEFAGPGGGYSPEDLYILSVLSCLIATFKVFAQKAGLEFGEISAKGTLMIDRNEQGIPELKKLDTEFTLTGVQDQEKAKTILAESEKYCLVSNAIKTEKSFQYNFS